MTTEGTDLGEVLTKFEEIFGSLVEHEVIKMVLQSCGWDSVSASEMIIGMIDLEQLPPHVRSAVIAGTIVRGGTSSPRASPKRIDVASQGGSQRSSPSNPFWNTAARDGSSRSSPARSVADPDTVFYSDGFEESNDIGEEGILNSELHDARLVSRNDSPTLLINRHMNAASGRGNHSSVLTPFAMAQGAIAKEPYIGFGTHNKSWSMTPTLPLLRKEEDKEIVDALPRDDSNDRDSHSASPPSPLQATAPVLDFETNHVHDSSEWVFAPEFVPTATQRFWPQRPIYDFALISEKSVQPSNGLHNMKAKATKKEEIIGKILSGKKMLILMRGLPGSGKSSLAKEIKGCSGVILSADDFFCDKYGRYNYEPNKIRDAHAWNMNRARLKLQESRSPIIIDNTNIQAWEMEPYVKLALQHGYDVDILEPETSWKLSPRELAIKNIHGVPKSKIKGMLGRYDANLTIDHVINSIKGLNLQREADNENSKLESQLAAKTDWPLTLPEPSGDVQKVIVNGEDTRNLSNGLYPINGISDKSDIIPEQSLRFPNISNVEFTTNSSQSYPPMNEQTEEGEDDPDVVVEGYEDSEESDYGTTSKDIFITENQESLHHKDSDTLSINSPEDVSHIEENVELQNEEKIRALIEESNADIGEFDTDWDDLAREANEEELNDEKFLELVNMFGSSVKYELEKAKGCNENGSPFAYSESTADIDEDSAMYDLCSNMEDKIGQSLSSAIIRPNVIEEPSSLFSIINTSELGDCNGNTDSVEPFSASVSVEMTEESKVSCKNLIDVNDNPSAHGMSYSNEEVLRLTSIEKKSYIELSDLPLEESTEGNSSNSKTEEPHDAEKTSVSDHDNTVVGKDGGDGDNKLSDNQESLALELENHKDVENVVDADEIGDKTSINPCTMNSWECVEINNGECSVDWETLKANEKEDGNSNTPKPTRDCRRRTSGDPNKWLLHKNEETSDEKLSCTWEPVSEGAISSWESGEENTTPRKEGHLHTDVKPQAHTGAVPKTRVSHASYSPIPKITGHSNNSIDKIASPSHSISPVSHQVTSNASTTKIAGDVIEYTYVDADTQTLSIDFQALELDNNLYELKILYGQPDYVPACGSDVLLPENGPLTKGKLMLDKGSMTENVVEATVLKPLKSLVSFFPQIPESDLKDVLEKCKYDLDWAMNVLLDGGYKMAELVDACDSQEDSEAEDIIESKQEAVNTCDANERHSALHCDEIVDDLPMEERSRRLRQSQQPDDLIRKRDLENAFTMSETVDDRIIRLTGKDFDNLNINKIKKKKSKKKHSKKKHCEESINWAEGEGAQYVTLVMDPLFASQLISMFGPIGSCGMSGDMVPEDRSVILPLEFCHQIHKYWTNTLDGKFSHEAEVFDSLIREDENLARRLQDEEDLLSKTKTFANAGALDDPEKVFELDPPSNFREIMDLEQALQVSQGDVTAGNVASLSSHLSLQRLYNEFPHVDREALKQEFNDSGLNYQEALRKVSNRYGYEQSTPKTVIAPEYLVQYEQQQILKATKLSLEQQELVDSEVHHDEEDEFHPDDPQIYRDEAQTHYLQRQEYYRRAQEAHRHGMKAAAAYYASIGKLHSEKLREANERASKKILEAVNAKKDANVLDLHLLHVPEALSATQAFLAEREQVVAARGISHMQVSLITGHGAHSEGGQARLKPAIKDFLQKRGYVFHEANIGMFDVTLRNK